MDSESKKVFDEILAKSQEGLTRPEIEFLMARRSYMNDADRKRYADMIKAHEDGTLFPTEEGEEGDLANLSLKELKALAKEKGVKGFSSMKAPELIKELEALEEEGEEDDE